MTKNPAAVALGKSRWDGVSAEKRSESASKAASAITPESASERARKAQATRKRNAKLAKKTASQKNISAKNAVKNAVSE